MALICHPSLCSQRHIVVHVELVVVTTSRTMTLAYNTTNREISCHSARQVLCLML